MSFNPHSNKTANGITITVGLKVLNYDYVEGVVLSDDYDKEWQCSGEGCRNEDGTSNHGRVNDLTEDFLISSGRCSSPCSHDHWFTVETANGTKSFNGSRLKAI